MKSKLVQSEGEGLSPGRRQLPSAPNNQIRDHILKGGSQYNVMVYCITITVLHVLVALTLTTATS